MKRISTWILLILLLVAAGAALFIFNPSGSDVEAKNAVQPEQAVPKPRVVKVSVIPVEPAPIKDVLVLPGETQPWLDIILAADMEGQVEKTHFKEGDVIKTGELIAEIDVKMLAAAVNNARASLALLGDLHQRRAKLRKQKIISQESLDLSNTDKVLAEGALRQAQISLEKGLVRSPIDGILNVRYLDPGEFARKGNPVANLVNIDKIEIEVNAPELDVRYLKPGQQCLVTIDALPEQKILGIIDFVAFKADPATKTFRIKVIIENPDHIVRPGMIARTAFLKRIVPDAFSAPLFALVDRGGERLVYVEKDGLVHARTVELGVIEGDKIQITKGLEEGDNLIVVGHTEVQEGTRVEIQ